MTSKTFKPVLFLFIAFLMLISAACGGGGQAPAPTQAPAATQAITQPTQPPAASPTEAPTQAAPTEETSGAVNAITDAKKAIIQIESQGSFTDPQVGQVLNGAGRGSGASASTLWPSRRNAPRASSRRHAKRVSASGWS